jgi:hypothetical protein
MQTFRAVRPGEEPPAFRRVPCTGPSEAAAESDVPAWISPWGVASLCCAALALITSTALGIRWLTLLVAAVGIIVVVVGVYSTGESRDTKDRVWLSVGGGLNGLVLCVALFVPGLLNSWWWIDTSAPTNDPNHQVVVPYDDPLAPGRQPVDDEWADAASEAVRQNDALVRLQSVKIGPLKGRGSRKYLLVHFRLANCGREQIIKFDGFVNNAHRLVLTSESGQAYPLLEQRKRKPTKAPAVFEESSESAFELLPTMPQDLLLVFEAPPSSFEPLRLEVPSSAWGRNGVCRLRIAAPFEFVLPGKKP